MTATPEPGDRPVGFRWLPDAARTEGEGALRAKLASGTVTAIIRTPFADRHELPAAFWRDDDTAGMAEGAFTSGWLRIPRPKGWCKWIEGYVWVPSVDSR